MHGNPANQRVQNTTYAPPTYQYQPQQTQYLVRIKQTIPVTTSNAEPKQRMKAEGARTRTHEHRQICVLIRTTNEFSTYLKLFHPSVVTQLPAFCLLLSADFPTRPLNVPQNVVQLCPY